MRPISVDAFCYHKCSTARRNEHRQFTSTNIAEFLVQNPFFARDVKFPSTASHGCRA